MHKIKIGDAVYEAIVRHGSEMLSLEFRDMKIEDVAAMLDEEYAKEIRVLKADGTTDAIYKNHALFRVTSERLDGTTRVVAMLNTQKIEQTQAEQMMEQIELAKKEISDLRRENDMLIGCMLEMSEAVYA